MRFVLSFAWLIWLGAFFHEFDFGPMTFIWYIVVGIPGALLIQRFCKKRDAKNLSDKGQGS